MLVSELKEFVCVHGIGHFQDALTTPRSTRC